MAALRILHLEDDPTDRLLVAEVLRADGLACEIVAVHTRDAFERALDGGSFDLILADYQLPAFDGLAAQTIAAARAGDVPFIFVSGTLGEELAVERLKAGATDYVLKQRLSRLPSCVRRALEEARVRREQRRAEQDLRRLNAELDARVASRTAELAAANAAVEGRERQLAESEARLQAVLDHSPAAISVKDLSGRYLLVNREFARLVGRTPGDVAGLEDEGLFAPRLAGVYAANDREVRAAGERRQFEEPFLSNGELRIYAANRFPLRDAAGQVYATCAIALDVTERRHAEEAARLTAREAARANLAKSEFLSRMSHDLRTPLNAIIGFAQLLEADVVDAEQADNVRQILRGGRHLLDLINEVLDISRIESGHLSLSLEPVPMGDIIRRTVELMAPLAREQGLALTATDVADWVLADRQRMIQVLINLVSNAIKYNRPNGSVSLSCETLGDRVRLLVADTGYGIPRDKRRLLFQPFERLGAERSAVQGTGLGLAVAKGLIEAMGGTIGVESTADVGSTFWIELQRADERADSLVDHAAETAITAARPEATGTLLYIEDNPSNLKLMERILNRRPNVKLLTACEGGFGIELARTHLAQLIFLDLHLPDMSGEEVLRRLWETQETRAVPVVVLSADATPQQSSRLRASGATAYLTKPFNIASVLEVIDTYMLREPHA